MLTERIPDRNLADEHYIAMHFAYNAMRKAAHGFTSNELANRLGCSRDEIEGRLSGRLPMTFSTFSEMANAMNCRLHVHFVPYGELRSPEQTAKQEASGFQSPSQPIDS